MPQYRDVNTEAPDYQPLPFYTSDYEDDLDLAERLRASLVAQSGEDAAILAVAPAPEAPSPVAVAEAVLENLPPAEAATPLEATDAVISALADVPETADEDIPNPGASATGE
jgi:hypothetical protein